MQAGYIVALAYLLLQILLLSYAHLFMHVLAIC